MEIGFGKLICNKVFKCFGFNLNLNFRYEVPNQPSSFTPEQLIELRKAKLSRLICDNTDLIDTVQIYPMVLPDHEM